MSDHQEFLFALELSDEPPFDEMMGELARAVLAAVGYAPDAVDDLRRVLHAALASGSADGHRSCDVRFRAHGGELSIAVSYAGGAQWRTTRPLP